MRDIRTDLKDRAHAVAEQIDAENARFESLISQLKAEHGSSQEHLRAQLRLANKLVEFIAWQAGLRAEIARRIAAAEVAENFIRKGFSSADS